MATTCYFEETVIDQGEKTRLDVEIGRSSYYNQSPLPNGKTGEDSIYLRVDDTFVVLDRATAKRLVEAVMSVGMYHGLIDS